MAGTRELRADFGSGPPTAALSAGFGSTATATFSASSKDSGGRVSVLCQGSGIAANPTITLTFKDGGFNGIPAIIPGRGDIQSPAGGYWALTTASATAPVFTFVGTPVTATTYVLDYSVRDTIG